MSVHFFPCLRLIHRGVKMSYSFRQKSGFVLLTLFSIFNALFFIGVYVQLRFGAPYYKTVLPAYQFL